MSLWISVHVRMCVPPRILCANISVSVPVWLCQPLCVSVFMYACLSVTLCVCVCVCVGVRVCRGAVSFGLVVSIIRSLSFTPVSFVLFLFLSSFLLPLTFPSVFPYFSTSPSPSLPPPSPLSFWLMSFKSSSHSSRNDERGQICPFLSVYSAFHLCPSVLIPLFIHPTLYPRYSI